MNLPNPAPESPSPSLQESILAALAFDDEKGQRLAAVVQAVHFDVGPYRDIAAKLLDYRLKYKRPPGRAHLDDLFDGSLAGERKATYTRLLSLLSGMAPDLNGAFVLERAGSFVRSQRLKAAIFKAAEQHVAGGEDAVPAVEAALRRVLDESTPISTQSAAMPLSTFLALPMEKPEALVSPILHRGDSVMLHGPTGSAKTLLALHITLSLAAGRGGLVDQDGTPIWLVERRARVLYVDGELAPVWLHDRLGRFPVTRPRWRYDGGRRRGPAGFHVLSKLQAEADGNPVPSLYTAAGRAVIDRAIEAAAADVVVLDNVFDLFGVVVDGEPEKWTEVKSWIGRHRAAGRAFLLIHHDNKAGGAYGTVAREAGVDAEIALKKTDDPAVRTVEMKKARHSEKPAPFDLRLYEQQDGHYGWEVVAPNRGGRPRILDHERVLDLAGQGRTTKEIAAETGVKQRRIQEIIKEARKPAAL